MNRKYFLSSLIPVAATAASLKVSAATIATTKKIAVPPYLKSGDTIGITCPAGYIKTEAIQPAVQLMQSWGFNIKTGQTVGKRDFTMGGTDAERLADLQQMLDDPSIKAIMCARGGYGAVHIIDQLDFKKFIANPKWLIGFSDITVLHSHIHTNCHVASLHSKMCNSFPDNWSLAEPIQMETILSIKQALIGQKMAYTSPASAFNRTGNTAAPLVGGNLSIIATLTGTKSDINTDGKILFLEDTGEYLYNIDRMLYNLQRSGKLQKLAGLIIGGFKVKPDEPDDEFGKTLYEVVLDRMKNYPYPVCFDFPVGHQKNNFAFKCGVTHTLKVTQTGGTLTEA